MIFQKAGIFAKFRSYVLLLLGKCPKIPNENQPYMLDESEGTLSGLCWFWCGTVGLIYYSMHILFHLRCKDSFPIHPHFFFENQLNNPIPFARQGTVGLRIFNLLQEKDPPQETSIGGFFRSDG